MLTTTETIVNIEVTPDGGVNVIKHLTVFDGDTQVAQTGKRYLVAPGQDYSGEDPKVAAICAAVHTPECIAAYLASLPPVSEPDADGLEWMSAGS